MGLTAAGLILTPILLMTLAPGLRGASLPEVVERTLSNRMRVLVVERNGPGVRAELFLQGGRASTGGLPAAAADLMARTLFRRMFPPQLDARASTPLEAWDALDELGATRRELRVEADYLSWGVDLPAAALSAWCRLESNRLRHLSMAAFPLERERLLREIDAGMPPSPPERSILLATALAGHPYALAGDFQRSRVEALGPEDVRRHAAGAIRPDRLTLVVVGAVKADQLLPALEKVIAAQVPAEPSEAVPTPTFEDPQDSQAASGSRRLTVSTQGAPRLLFSWRIPPLNHADGAALEVLAQVLGASPSSRLQARLTAPGGLARSLNLQTGVPGSRQGNLLLVDAEPAEGRSLEELEQAVQGEILRLTREPIPESELRRAQVELETRQLILQEDATTLAHALGEAQCLGGDWRLAFRALEAGRDMKPAEIQRVARTYLTPARATLVQLGPDPLLVPMDRTETRLLQVLTALVQRKLGGEAQAQNVLREAMRQIRMLSSAERERTLKLLEAQVTP